MSVRVSFLGGLGDIGRNCASIEVAGTVTRVADSHKWAAFQLLEPVA